MYRKIIRPILFRLNPEQAHRLVVLVLRMVGWIPGAGWLLERCCALRDERLEREVFGVKFQNPIGVAAGLDRSAECFRELGAMGFGFVEVGTITPRAQSGNPTPRMFRRSVIS
ncbi:MAG: quinone-dependent dihydroorotate dehydrogenase, partial [Alistipes sp.]|nr:quinone-dependent dihydroorotate dehydrogenase [Alistipes sp.]